MLNEAKAPQGNLCLYKYLIIMRGVIDNEKYLNETQTTIEEGDYILALLIKWRFLIERMEIF